jgi:hypothetical protein
MLHSVAAFHLQPAGSSELEEKLPKTRASSTGRCNTISKFTCRSLKAQSLSRALIEAQSYLVEIGLRVAGQVGFLGKVLSQ